MKLTDDEEVIVRVTNSDMESDNATTTPNFSVIPKNATTEVCFLSDIIID